MENFGYPLEELFPIAAELASVYSGYEHSSITYEKAQMLMGGVIYCVNACGAADDYALSSKHVSAKEAYAAGQKIVMEKVTKLREIYNELIIDFQDYGVACLKDTIVKGIPIFLSGYDVKYAPQKTILTLDYPILKDLGASSGVIAVLEYVKCICLEQQFLKKFDSAYIIEILRAYHDDYGLLVENICEIVLQNTIGHILLEKPLHLKGFSKKDFKKVEHILMKKSEIEMEHYLEQALHLVTERYYDNDIGLLEYLTCDVPNIAVRMQCNLQNHSLDKLFFI